MPDIFQHGQITTLHDLGTTQLERLEQLLVEATRNYKIGLVLPVTAADMRAAPFSRIVDQLEGIEWIARIVVPLGKAPQEDDYLETRQIVERLSDKTSVLWLDGPHVSALYQELTDAGVRVSEPGKGLGVWTAFGFLLADNRLKAFALHDCDIANYEREMLARLCLPLAHPSLDFEFCKAYYSRHNERLHGRVMRLLMVPLYRALNLTVGPVPFLDYLGSFRYPLSGEFAVSTSLARSLRVPGDWGLEIGTLAEVFANTSLKRVCQVEICKQYQHKHQPFSIEDPSRGLMKMARDILMTLVRTLATMGQVVPPGHFSTLRCAYLRAAQDGIRQYYADSLMNDLEYDRHEEELAIEAFADQIVVAGEAFHRDPSGGQAISNWTRVLAAFPDFPARLHQAAERDSTLSREGLSTFLR
jgi:glucosyl-3-phosphoglycerate synthase